MPPETAWLPRGAQQLPGPVDIAGDDVAVVQSAQVPDAAARDALAPGRQSAWRRRSASARQQQSARVGTVRLPRSDSAGRPRLRSAHATLQVRCESKIRLYSTRAHGCKSACHRNCNDALRPRTDARAAGAHTAARSRADTQRHEGAGADAQGDLWERRNSESVVDDLATGGHARAHRHAGGQHSDDESPLCDQPRFNLGARREVSGGTARQVQQGRSVLEISARA